MRKWSQQRVVNDSSVTKTYVDAQDAATKKAAITEAVAEAVPKAVQEAEANAALTYLPLAGGTMTGAIKAANGTAALPSVAFGTTSGFFNDLTNSGVGLSIGGIQQFQFGARTTVFDYSGGTATVRVQGEGSTAINLRRSTNDTGGAAVAFQKQRGTIASPVVPNKNDALGSFNFQGYNGSGYTNGATCSGFLIETGTVGASAMGSEIRFLIAPIGSVTLSNTLSFNPQDGLKWGGTAVANAFLDANRLLLLRGFATGSLPAGPATGALAYDTTTGAPKFYNGSAWGAIGTTVSPANPSATASDVAVNGSAATFMRSDAAPAVQKCSTSQFGLAKPDGTSIVANSGVLSAVNGSGLGGIGYHFPAAALSGNDLGSFATLGNEIILAEAIRVSALYGAFNAANIGDVYSMFIATLDSSNNINGTVVTATARFTTTATGLQQHKFAITPTILSGGIKYYIGLVITSGTGTTACRANGPSNCNYPTLPLDQGAMSAIFGQTGHRRWFAQNSDAPSSATAVSSNSGMYGIGLLTS